MTIDYAPELGKRFVTVLEEWLTPEEFETVRTRNDAREPGVCHSHDFCDANMAMERAWQDVLGRTPGFAPENDDPEYEARCAASEADSVLWGRAWDWAIDHYLSHSPTAMALEADGFPEVTAADPCGACDHGRGQHAFFPNGQPAPLCVDAAPGSDQCDCEGFTSPVAATV